MKTNSQIWDESLAKLKGNWGMAIVAAIIATAIMGAPRGVNEFLNAIIEVMGKVVGEGDDAASIVLALGALVAFPLMMIMGLLGQYLTAVMTVGLYRFFSLMNRENKTDLGTLFSGFKQSWVSFGILFMSSLYIGLWTLAWIAPVGILLGAVGTGLHFGGIVDFSDLSGGTYAFLIFVALIIWLLPGTVIGAVKGLSYSMSLFILAENSDAKVLESIDLSKKMMNGNKMQAFMLSLRVTGLMILSVFTLFIGLLWVIPWSYEMSTLLYDSIFRGRQRRAVVEIG